MKHILCADIGTTSLKIGIISENGEVVSFYRHGFSEKNDFLANEWNAAFFEHGRKLVSAFQAAGGTIDGISLSGNGPTLIAQNGRTLLWNDDAEENGQNANDVLPSGTAASRDGENGTAGTITHATACALPNEAKNSLFIPRILAFKKRYAADYNASAHLFSNPEFLIHALTGSVLTILPEERFAPAYWNEEALRSAGIDSSKFGSFVPTGHFAGLTTQDATLALTLARAVPVFCGGPDFVTALIGTGTVVPGALCDRAGSSEGINFCTQKPFFAPMLRTLPSVIPSLWNVSFIIEKSGILMDEYKAQIEALEQKPLTYEEIVDLCFDDRNSEGWRILCELCEKIKRGLFALRTAAEQNGIAFPDVMTITGGQAKNRMWLTEKALQTGIQIAAPATTDAELLGNAAVVLHSLNVYHTLQDASRAVCGTTRIFPATAANADKKNSAPTVYRIPKRLKTIIFDIDSTLYTNRAYAFEQVDVQIRHYAKKHGMSAADARNRITAFRRAWSKAHEGKKISLGNTLTHFGVTIAESVEMRRTLLEPARFLNTDECLIQTLKKLSERFTLICVTNNPVLPARKTLDALGISDLIPEIIGLDTCGKSKPAREPFEEAMRRTKSAPEECLSVGDRYDMDISLPLEMGMGGILVGGVKDVYALPNLLFS